MAPMAAVTAPVAAAASAAVVPDTSGRPCRTFGATRSGIRRKHADMDAEVEALFSVHDAGGILPVLKGGCSWLKTCISVTQTLRATADCCALSVTQDKPDYAAPA